MRKGQAALEFLTTYGWAFLVILVMIGALAGFGILSPSNFLPNRCNFASELPCSEAGISDPGALGITTVELYLQNGLGNSVELQNLEMSWEGKSLTNASLDCTINGVSGTELGGAVATTATAGANVHLECAETLATDMLFPGPGEKIKLQVSLEYRPLGKNLWQGASGEIYYKIV